MLSLMWIAAGEPSWSKRLYDFGIGTGLLWMMYRQFQGLEEERQRKDDEIKRLKEEQKELMRLILEQEGKY